MALKFEEKLRNKLNSPHGKVLQATFSTSVAPDTKLLRVRFRTPDPHDKEHSFHSDQNENSKSEFCKSCETICFKQMLNKTYTGI